jgi:hypothetical protein
MSCQVTAIACLTSIARIRTTHADVWGIGVTAPRILYLNAKPGRSWDLQQCAELPADEQKLRKCVHYFKKQWCHTV